MAVPLRPYSSSVIDETATARLAAKSGENLIAKPS
jgi:hypothetical protein